MACLAISPLKVLSIIPFLQGSKWLPCNELILGSLASNVMAVDKGGRRTKGEEMKEISEGLNGKSNWLTRLLNFGTEYAKAVLTALTVTILFRLSLVEPRSILMASMYPTLDVGDRVLTEKVLSIISILGSAFWAILAAGPALIEQTTHLTVFRGFAGTSVLILVGCATDRARKVQAEIISQKYKNIEFYEIDKL